MSTEIYRIAYPIWLLHERLRIYLYDNKCRNGWA